MPQMPSQPPHSFQLVPAGGRRVIVAGGGPAGLACALALVQSGVETVLITPQQPPVGTGAQARSAALFPASLALLDNLGVFEACRAACAPLRAIRLIDDTGGLLRAPEVVFAARDIGANDLGWNVPNAALSAALNGALASSGGALTWLHDEAVAGLVSHGGEGVQVRLASGGTIEAALVVAADGRQSVCRAAAAIPAKTWRYDQTAVTAAFTHQRPHDGVSTEFHRDCGPCTSVPLPGNASALVWVERPAIASRLLAMDDAAFTVALEDRLQGLLGTISRVSPRGAFPLSGLQAETYAKGRVMLVGEAAHVMPPIGAQGLNLGLRDVACLVDCVTDALAQGRDPGGPEALSAYNEARAADIGLRMTAVDALNRSLLTDLAPVRLARGLALHAIAAAGPLRRRLMAEGLRPSGVAPRLMRARDGGSRCPA